MKHLTEEEFIDLLLGESEDARLRAHLRECVPCTDQMTRLENGLSVARAAEPKQPLFVQPKISFQRFRRHQMISRMSWVAAASLLLLSLLGFRLEVNESGFGMQFGLLGFSGKAETDQSAQLQELEARVLEAIELKAELAQQDLDRRLDSILEERQQGISEVNEYVQTQMKDLELETERDMVVMREEFLASQNTRNLGRTP